MNSLQYWEQYFHKYKIENETKHVSITVFTNSQKKIEVDLQKISIELKNSIPDEWYHYISEFKKVCNCIINGTLEETKVWIVAFKFFNPSEFMQRNPDRYFVDALHKVLRLSARLTKNISKAKFLIEEIKVSPHEKISRKGPVLQYAAKHGNLELVKYLVEVQKVDIEARGTYITKVNTALSRAVSDGHYDIAEYLIKSKASIDPNLSNGQQLLLAEAVNPGSLKMVTFLAEKGASVVDHRGNSHALQSALEIGNLEIVKYLLQKGANVNEVLYEPAIITAARNGNLDLFLFLANDLKLDVLNPGYTYKKWKFSEVVSEALISGSIDLVRHLITNYKVNIVEFLEKMPSHKLSLALLRFLLEELKLDPDKINFKDGNRKVEVAAYFYSISKKIQPDEKEYFLRITNKGLISCDLKILKIIHEKQVFDPYDIKLTARHQLIQLYFVKPLLQALEKNCASVIAKKICSYLDIEKMTALSSRYVKENKNLFWSRIFLRIPKEQNLRVN